MAKQELVLLWIPSVCLVGAALSFAASLLWRDNQGLATVFVAVAVMCLLVVLGLILCVEVMP